MTAGSSTKGPAFASLDDDRARVGEGVREASGPFEGEGQRAAMVDAEVEASHLRGCGRNRSGAEAEARRQGSGRAQRWS